VAWRAKVSHDRVRRFADEEYWGKPLPGFGDPQARMLIIGLAPAAHGGNRTGRMFTGDRSGEWLYRALHKAGFANQAESTHRDDGLRLTDCYISAAVRCAPPLNKPTPEEMRNCRPYLVREAGLLPRIRVVVALGKTAFETAMRVFDVTERPRPSFRHGAICTSGDITIIASYHPSQQNTFTRRLTRPMFDRVFASAKKALSG
jgi:uracil-DNA glycosylase family 4